MGFLKKIFEDGNEKKDLPNVIMILVDGTRYDFAKNHPNYQSFFRRGTLFSNMITYAPYTISAVHAIFTGAYGSKNGVDNYYGSLGFKKDQFKTTAEYFKNAGHFTFGDSLNEVCVPSFGFDRFTIQEEDYDCSKKHLEMLNELKEINKRDKKCFLFLHYRHIHDSMVNNVGKKYGDFSKEYFEQQQLNRKNYDKYISKADQYLEKIYQELEKLKLFDDSLIVLFSDHGASTGERIGEKIYGSYCYDYTLKMFSVFIYPKKFPIKKINTMTRSVDIFPTILDSFNIQPFSQISGKSLFPLIEDNEKVSRVAFSQTAGLGGPYPSPKKPNVSSVRTNKWKLIHNHTPNTYELYNLIDDPQETDNLYGKRMLEEEKLKALLAKEVQR